MANNKKQCKNNEGAAPHAWLLDFNEIIGKHFNAFAQNIANFEATKLQLVNNAGPDVFDAVIKILGVMHFQLMEIANLLDQQMDEILKESQSKGTM